MEETIRKAEPQDIKKVESFLVEANLDTEGLEECIDFYSLLETKSGTLKACIGIEPVDGIGLLRSFVVSPSTTQVQIMLLFDRVMKIAQNKQLSYLYLVTNKESAASFFNKIGFVVEEDIPEQLVGNPHFTQVKSVDNSIIMKMTVESVGN
jgi:N-acetylglutamate synthase-like GNAT family acetyltransferase